MSGVWSVQGHWPPPEPGGEGEDPGDPEGEDPGEPEGAPEGEAAGDPLDDDEDDDDV